MWKAKSCQLEVFGQLDVFQLNRQDYILLENLVEIIYSMRNSFSVPLFILGVAIFFHIDIQYTVMELKTNDEIAIMWVTNIYNK